MAFCDAASNVCESLLLGGPQTAVKEPQMSVKLSSLCPRFDELSRYIALPMLTEAMGSLVDAGGDPRPGGLNKTGRGVTIFVDGEEQSRLEMTLAGGALR